MALNVGIVEYSQEFETKRYFLLDNCKIVLLTEVDYLQEFEIQADFFYWMIVIVPQIGYICRNSKQSKFYWIIDIAAHVNGFIQEFG